MLGGNASSELATYEILALAGTGGSGSVYQARPPGAEAIVALKVAPSCAGSAALAREATYAALALSPRLPELVDVGWALCADASARAVDPARHADAVPFVALRWAPGAPLAPLTSLTPLTSERGHAAITSALGAARDVGDALADLHAMGAAHGDVKPANLIAFEGIVRVIDLGLAGPLHATTVHGATLRYLDRGSTALGDARARDLVALGAVLAELGDPVVAAAEDPIAAARSTRLPGALGAICAALLAPSPAARPSAAWVAATARAALRALGVTTEESTRGIRDARRVRATYLRLRGDELAHASSARDDAAPWLADAAAQAARARSIAARGVEANGGAGILAPLPPDQRARWLTALVGSAAAAWPLGGLASVPERALAIELTDLAHRLPPAAWTFHDVESAALGRPAHPRASRRDAHAGVIDAAEAAHLALSIAAVPVSTAALEQIEQRDGVPTELLLAAADALRLRGELGRARSLVLRDVRGADALAAEILRRAGDLGLAAERARRAIAEDADPTGRARAVLARLALDRGDLDEAARLSEDAATAAVSEVAALVRSARGDTAGALAEVTRGEALAVTAEERARLAGARGYVAHASDPEAAFAAFAAAVDHAARSGAIVEEATYRTGEAAAAVGLGELGAAIAEARRAALLWEHLDRPALAARALLAAAAAYATAGAAHDTRRIAAEAAARARDGGDRRAEAYAGWAYADVAAPGDPDGLAAAERSAALLDGEGGEDAIRAAARLLRHGAPALVDDAARISELDRLAGDGATLSPGARLDWWGARAARLVDGAADGGEAIVLAAITGLAEARAPLGARGPALAAGQALAAQRGRGDAAQRLLALLGDVARELVRRAPPELADAIHALPWVTRAAAAVEPAIRPEQARDLEALIRSFSDHERLGPLLDRILDALVLWTGVERGLLLLRAPDGRLVPRAARNLARADLTAEQMSLSQTLAKRALEAGEPVIAVDAAGELPSFHQSVHALKLRSVLAIPLVARGEALGVAYLDDRVRRGAFGPREISFARTIASLAALVIADARDQVLLRRAARRAKRASAEIAETLARREAALDVAERELSKARGERGTRFKYDEIVGESPAIRAMLKIVDRVTAAEIPVLISGESGSGKELVARAIHHNGPRASRPFVSENCGAIPEGLLESTLFGHVRGAFTGASTTRAGLFEVAHQGTLFLDEIGEMSLPMQTKLLRVLEDGLVRPVGSERERKVDVRIIAATHRDLEAMVKARTFREDLFYRLNIISIRVPPLRERAEDIPRIVRRLLDKHGPAASASTNTTSATSPPRVTVGAMDRLIAFAWPGNVRQLENEIRRCLVLSDGVIDEDHLSPEIALGPAPSPRELGLDVRARVDALETTLVREALERTKGNQTKAAKLLGLSRFGLQKMIKRLQIAL
jgi:transcriptional regulator with GAF, ATPase, and Fis domain